MCRRILKHQTTAEGEIPFYKIGTFGGKPDAYISKSLYEDYKDKYPYPMKGEVLISAAGTIGKAVVYDGEPAYFQDSNIVWVSNNEHSVLNDFLYYAYQNIKWAPTKGGTILRLYNKNLAETEIFAPSLDKQREIVSQIEIFENQIAELEQQMALIGERKQAVLKKYL